MPNKYQYSTPYSGRTVAPLPPGYMEAATAPGRNLAAGISSLGEGVGDAIKRFSDDAKAAKSLRTLVGIYQPEMKDRAETMSKSELEGAVRGFVMKADADERAAEAARRSQAFPLEQEARELGIQQGQADLRERERQARALAAFNQSIAGQGPDPVATAAGAMADPRSGVTLSSLDRFIGQNPVVPQLTPEMVQRLAAVAGVLTPQMSTQLTQLDNPLARMRAQADATQATAYAKQVDTSSATRSMVEPEVKSVGGRDYLRTSQGWKLLPKDPYAHAEVRDPEGNPIKVPLTREQFEQRMRNVPPPNFKNAKEESAWKEARDAIAQRPDLRDHVLRRLRGLGHTTEGL